MAESDAGEPLLLDAMLGKLSTYLRLCGYDTAYALDRDVEADADVLELARTEGRRVVTRDRQLAERAPDGVLLTEREVENQLRELAAAGFSLSVSDEPEYCGTCNAALDRVDEAASTPEYAPDPGETTVWRCRDCGQCFWKGSHWDSMATTIDSL